MLEQPSRILVADDDPSSLVILQRSLEKAGYVVHAATDGEQVIGMANDHKPDLVLLDVSMPGKDGFEVCSALRSKERTSDIPIIFVTATANSDQVLKAFSVGGRDYITKPYTTQEVLARVGVHMRLRRAEEELQIKNEELEGLNRELTDLCRLDPLTRLLNRRSWDEALIREHQRFERHGCPYSVVMIDVDHFKAYNDALGHQPGDECLVRIAEMLASTCREVDSVGRYGGEEFVILAPETGLENAVMLGDRIRRAVWGLEIPHPASPTANRITVSLGVAVGDGGAWEAVLRRADDAMYVAKRAGRNMVYADQAQDAEIQASAIELAPERPSPAVKDTRINVLVVDDDPTNRAVCKGCLDGAGYRVREADDGLAALARVREQQPDVIIMDVMMPNMDGLECTRALRMDPDTRDIPIVIVSALARTEDILAGLEAGADEYLSKPIRSSELVLRVRSMARMHRDREDLLSSYEERGKQMRILTRLVEFCRAVSNSKDCDEVLEHTVATVADVVLCRRVSIMLPDEEEEALTVASSMGVDKEEVKAVKVPFGEAISGRVYTGRQAVIVNSNGQGDSRSEEYDAPFFASFPLASAPLDAAGHVVGVLNATEKLHGEPFEARDLEYIELISKVAGTALHDIQMREARDQASDSIMVALAKLAEYRDNDTGKHLDRVTRFCVMLAETLRERDEYRDAIDDEFLYNLERAVPLHDIGKVAIPDEILLFPGRLDDEQMAIMRTHTTAGGNTIESLIERAPGVCFLEMAREIALFHHERFDGEGYPTGMAGMDIPLAARITSVADVYDALTTRRVYKEAFSHEKALSIICEGIGTQFDPDVVDALLQREHEIRKLARTMADKLMPEEEARLMAIAAR